MRTWVLLGLLSASVLTGCGTTVSSDGTGVDATADVSGTDAADTEGSDVPLVDATADMGGSDAVADTPPDVAGTDAAGTDAISTEFPPIDLGPDTPDTYNNGCCQTDSQCPKDTVCVPGKECVPLAKAGECWKDSDCKTGKCESAFVCPCTADCSTAWSVGKCSDNVGSCCGGTKGSCLASETCINNQVCKPSGVPTGNCWTDKDCAVGTCTGASVCPCGAMCIVADKMGTCTTDVKPGGCCANGAPCAVGESCVHGPDVCKSKVQLGKGQCWNDSDCAKGTCSGVNACPCGAMCLIADKPGTCSSGPTTCTTADPASFGLCDMVIGVVFDGKSCVTASGCGCGTCDTVFPDLAACQKICGI